MRILFGTDLFYQNTTGSTNFIKNLTRGLIQKKHQVFVIAPSKKFKNTIYKEGDVIVYGIRSVVIPEMIYPANFRIPITAGSNKIRKILEEIRPDIVNIQDHFMIGSKIAKEAGRLGIPTIGTNHFMPENFIHYLYPPQFAKKMIKKLAWKTFTRVYQHLDIITAPTETAARLIKSLGLKNPIVPVSNGVDLTRFHPKNGLDINYHKKDTPVFLFVGRLDKEKHIDVLLKAFAKVVPICGAKLYITGKGTERTNLILLAKKLGISKQVVFTGFVSDKDLPLLYRSADVFVIASIAELQSIATMEAMASGLPVIAARVMALPELVHQDKNGFLFEEGNIEELATYMIKLLQKPILRKKFARQSLKLIKKHDIKNTVKNYEQIYQRLCLN